MKSPSAQKVCVCVYYVDYTAAELRKEGGCVGGWGVVGGF